MPWYLRPAWVAGHVLVVAACLVMVRLGIWQWHVGGIHHGDLKNYSYAFQWWAFVAFALGLWVRVMRDRGGRPTPVVRSGFSVPAVTDGSPLTSNADVAARPAYRHYVMPQSDAIAVDDDELRAYNAYLASLDATAHAASDARDGAR